MIQYYKLFSLVIRVLIKPVVNFTKQYHMSKKEFSHERLRYFFIFLGKKYSLLEAKIYNTSLNQTSADLQKAKLLTEEVALGKGVEFFYEIVVYSTLVGLSLYELIVYLKHSTKESEDLTEKLKSYEEDIGSIHISVDHQNKNIDKKITNMKETIENFAKTLEDNRNKMMIDLKQTRKLIFRSLDENMELYNQVKDERSQFEKNCESLSLKNIEIMNSILKNGTNDVKFEKE